MWHIILISLSAIVIFGIFYRRYLVMQQSSYDAAATLSSQLVADLVDVTHDIAADVKTAMTQAEKEAEAIDFAVVNAAFRKADMYFSKGDLKQAEKHFIQVLSHYDSHHEALNRLGVVYIQTKRPSKAELLFRKLLSCTQKEPVYYSNFGRCLYNLGRLEEARDAYKQSVKLDSTRAARYVSLGQISYELGDYKEAAICFKKAVDIEPGNAEYMQLLANIYELTGNTEELRKILEKLAKMNPYNEELKEKLAKLV